MDAGNAMKKFLFILLLFISFPVSCFAWGGSMLMTMGGPPAGASCATQSFDVQNTGGTTNTITYDAEQWGQSFVAGVTKDLYSISLERGTAGTAYTIEVRVGASANLTSYLVSNTSCTVPAAAGFFECVFATHPTLTASTTYYIGTQHVGASEWAIKEGSATYANGQEFYEITNDWDFTGSGQTYDLNFKTKMCD